MDAESLSISSVQSQPACPLSPTVSQRNPPRTGARQHLSKRGARHRYFLCARSTYGSNLPKLPLQDAAPQGHNQVLLRVDHLSSCTRPTTEAAITAPVAATKAALRSYLILVSSYLTDVSLRRA